LIRSILQRDNKRSPITLKIIMMNQCRRSWRCRGCSRFLKQKFGQIWLDLGEFWANLGKFRQILDKVERNLDKTV